jgi:inner membrane protein
MDPVTHAVLGASLAQAVFGRRLGRTAALVGLVAGVLPDADVFIGSPADPLVAVAAHRGFTHAFAFVPVGALVAILPSLLWPAARARAGGRGWTLWFAAVLAYLSHILLDAATSYGTQLFWPFSDQRAGWDWIAVVDPAFTVPLAVGLAWALARRSAAPAFAGLACALAYLGLGVVQHERVEAALRELAARRGHAPVRLEVMPTLANQLVWRTLYEHGGRIHSDRVRVGWTGTVTLREGWSLPLAGPADLTAAERARDTRGSFARFAWFSEQWVARSPGDPTVLAEMRSSLSAEAFDPIWGIRFTPPGAPPEVEWINRSRERRIDLGGMWREIAGQ